MNAPHTGLSLWQNYAGQDQALMFWVAAYDSIAVVLIASGHADGVDRDVVYLTLTLLLSSDQENGRLRQTMWMLKFCIKNSNAKKKHYMTKKNWTEN